MKIRDVRTNRFSPGWERRDNAPMPAQEPGG